LEWIVSIFLLGTTGLTLSITEVVSFVVAARCRSGHGLVQASFGSFVQLRVVTAFVIWSKFRKINKNNL
jgi:hypothetical protein